MGHSKKRKRNEKPSNEKPSTENETETNIETPENSQTQNKTDEQSGTKRRARIIVRNLSFKSTEDKVKKHFEQYGPVIEVKILKKPDGKLVGCGFVQYKVVQNAAKAIYHLTGKPFLGRDIVCDWALGKNTYVKNMKAAFEKEIKEETIDEDGDVKIKDEKVSIDEDDDKKNIVDNTVTVKDSDEEESDDEKEESESESGDEEDDDEEDDESVKNEEPEAKRPRVISNDVQEGKTVFIKNVPFRATNEDVKDCLSQFGPLYYALVCVDHVTEHSKGTAFVKFVNQEDAEKCLEAGTELTLMGNILDCHRAISKNDLGNKNTKKEEKKDSRNLYLIKEGVILAGTKAAEGLSASDMAKRLELEKWKTQMLRNLNMFISRYRLIVHNLPPSYDDKKLRQLITKYAGSTAVIKEARVMRDLRSLDDKGVGKSKEFGFVSFTEHEDALRVLRLMNNNPDIFSKIKRPIVAFSIENKAIINARNKRLTKSRQNNPTCKEFNPNVDKKEDTKVTNAKEEKKAPFKKKKWQKPTEIDTQEKPFTGVTAKPGVSKMRSKFKLRTQAQLHHDNLKKEKNKKKTMKKSLQERKQDFIRQPSQKQGKGKKDKDDDNFAKLVNKYKSNLITNSTAKKNKWYET